MHQAAAADEPRTPGLASLLEGEGRMAVAALVAVLLSLLVAVVLGLWMDRREEVAAAAQRSAKQAEMLALETDDWLVERRRQLLPLATALGLGGEGGSQAAALRQAAPTLPQVQALAVVDSQGERLDEWAAPGADALPVEIRGALASLAGLPAGAFRVLATAPSGAAPQADSAGLLCTYTLAGQRVLVARMSAQPLQRLFSLHQRAPAQRLLLLDSMGQPVLRLGWPMGTQGMAAGTVGVSGQGQAWLDMDNEMFQFSWQQAPSARAAVVVGERRAELLAAFRQRAMLRIMVVALALALLAMIGSRAHAVLRTQRRLLQERDEAMSRWRGLVDMSSDWYWEQDAEFRFTHLGPQVAQVPGQTDLRMLGRCRWDAPALNLTEADWAQHHADLLAHRSFRDFEIRRPDVDGKLAWFSVSGEPVFAADGSFAGYRGMARDISARKADELQRQRLAEQLRESQKMEALGTLAGGIAHDFNNILGAILGNLVLVRARLQEEHPALAHVDLIQRAADRARHLVQQILAFGRRDAGGLQCQPLAPLVREAVDLLHATLPARVTLTTQLRSEGVQAMADATQMHQVLLNLCTNAGHAIPDSGGSIEVGLEEVELTEGHWPGASAGRHAHLWVRDTGHGMDAETLRRVFEPFFTTKPVGQGTGLGLAVVHGIVLAHQGGMTVDSTPGQGSCFHIYLPAQAGHLPMQTLPPSASPVPAAPPAGLGQGRHILCVDDDAVLRLTTQALLQQWGFRVSCAESGEEALALMARADDAVDAVLTDHNMPGMSGLALYHRLRQAFPALPVVIVSGNLEAELRRAARAPHGPALLEKERQHEALPALLEALLQPQAEAAEAVA